MRFAVVGAGAIGAFVGAMLAKSGQDVTLVARGAHGQAMQEKGVRVCGSLGEFLARPSVTDDPSSVGPVDVVLLALKAHSLTGMAPHLAPLLGQEAAVVSMQNGIPWWYFYRHGGEWEGLRLETVDPGGEIIENIEPRRAVGCVLYCSTKIVEPGVIEHVEGTRFAIGEPDGARSERCQLISKAFISAGLKCPVRTNIRHDIWVKLMGSVAFNPISALTRATLGEIIRCEETRLLARAVMEEAEQVASKLGVDVRISIEQRLAGGEKAGQHKTSMLQDVEAGRHLELEPIVGAVVELGKKLGVPMPHTQAVYACAKLLARSLEQMQAKCVDKNEIPGHEGVRNFV
ncbi:MAG TPA: 2-dehydropantoate 2-reductase [Blastocatellia bacterium]|nr:2-dehydropantoate 2-reductase [Blastocatellia bacterium]